MGIPIFKYWLIDQDKFWEEACFSEWGDCSDTVLRWILAHNVVFWDEALNRSTVFELLQQANDEYRDDMSLAAASSRHHILSPAANLPFRFDEPILGFANSEKLEEIRKAKAFWKVYFPM
jgi:hypothetical protein